MRAAPIFKDIVLVGGGHAHALLLRQWAMNPVPGMRLILISPLPQTPYSGMLPGLIAGHYVFDQIHIDLPRVCQWAGVRFIQDQVHSIDPDKQTLRLKNRPALHYDLVSIDIGSTPNHSVQGVLDYAAPVKPIAGFYAHWQETVKQLRKVKKEQTVMVVGGGAGSVEVILAMAWAVQNDSLISNKIHFKLVFRSTAILFNSPKSVIKLAEQACKRIGIALHNSCSVSVVEDRHLLSENGEAHSFDHLFWCTQASAPTWLADAGLACTQEGFIRVNEFLQSVNYPDIFAAGDIAHMDATPRPKAGVYAVRQAPILFQNIINKIQGDGLKPYRPQDNFFSLLSLGNKTAIGNRKPLPTISGAWAWRWKDHIDQKFMDLFQDLASIKMLPPVQAVIPALIPSQEKHENLNQEERCGGCGAKIGSCTLEEVLAELTGSYQPEDASSIDWPSATLLQTIDHISAPFDDPFLFGRIAVFHSLSDLFAMNAKAHSIHIAVNLPFAGREVQKRELRQLLQGVLSACNDLEVKLLGGHSAEGNELSISISANGSVDEEPFAKQALQAGDLLVLSKPLGTGLLLAGQMQQKAQGKDLSVALDWMNQSNQVMAEHLSAWGTKCCTDVTGFGLLGHLSEMLGSSTLKVDLAIEDIPILPGVLAMAKAGVRSTLFPQNGLALQDDLRWSSLQETEYWPVLLDPQTSGGLLAGIAAEHENAAREAGLFVIGRVY